MTTNTDEKACREGETLPYLGRPLLLKYDGADKVRPSGDGAYLLLPEDRAHDRHAALLHWYTARTEEIVRGLLPLWSKKLSLRPRSAGVRYAKTRWGSCNARGDLSFNSRIAMLSPDVAEYIVVHELCHLKQMNHSKAFWDEVAAALPNWPALRRKLRQEERTAVL